MKNTLTKGLKTNNCTADWVVLCNLQYAQKNILLKISTTIVGLCLQPTLVHTQQPLLVKIVNINMDITKISGFIWEQRTPIKFATEYHTDTAQCIINNMPTWQNMISSVISSAYIGQAGTDACILWRERGPFIRAVRGLKYWNCLHHQLSCSVQCHHVTSGQYLDSLCTGTEYYCMDPCCSLLIYLCHPYSALQCNAYHYHNFQTFSIYLQPFNKL